jgi:hypothetical protein
LDEGNKAVQTILAVSFLRPKPAGVQKKHPVAVHAPAGQFNKTLANMLG